MPPRKRKRPRPPMPAQAPLPQAPPGPLVLRCQSRGVRCCLSRFSALEDSSASEGRPNQSPCRLRGDARVDSFERMFPRFGLAG